MTVYAGQTTLTEAVLEKTTHVLSGVMKDQDGVAIPAAAVATCTLTLYDRTSGSVINGRSETSILNANGGTWDSGGNWSFVLTAADNAIIDVTRGEEWHVAQVTFTYSLYTGRHLIHFRVANLSKVA